MYHELSGSYFFFGGGGLLLHTLTEANQVPHIRLWAGGENHVHQPEGVKNFYAHPGEGAEQGVVEARPHPTAHTFPSEIGQDASKEEEQIEEGKRDS